ncbi:MAG TPA: metal ABC transporter permease [Bacteroidales bacterium]
MSESLFSIFRYQFVLHALMAAVLASISCGIVGTYIVARRKVFISGGITHASFGGIGIGYYLGINPVLGAAVFSILSAVGIEYISKKTDVREDSAIGILWSLGMAIGIIFIFITPGYAPNLMMFLFGSILTVTWLDIYLMMGLCLLIVAFFLAYYRLILYISFDEDYARAHRAPVNFINYLLMSMIALTIVLHIRVVGIILVISFLTIPQSTANLYSRNFRTIIFLSILIGLVGSVAGLIMSYSLDIPSGASIIFAFVTIFVLAKILRHFQIKRSIREAMLN